MSQHFEGQPASRDIDRLDTENTMRALREQMWGSQQNPGLIWAIGDLTKNVNKLTDTVASLSTDIHSDEGVRATVKDLRREAAKVSAKIDMFERWLWRIVWSLAFIGLGTTAVLVRIGVNMSQGK